MDYPEIRECDYDIFHSLANAYYREGADESTPQAEVDSFIRFLFGKVISGELRGCFAKTGQTCIGFALWALDTEDFAFSQLPGYGTILEIGLIPSCRGAGRGKELVTHVERCLRREQATQCYVCAYDPAQPFWRRCGYIPSGQTATNGLPIMTKPIG